MGYTFPVAGYSGKTELHHGEHQGAVDLFAARGTAVVAMIDGLIESAGYDETGGYYVSMRGDDGLTYYFAHLDALPLVGSGQRVTSGQRLGGVGESGNAAGTGPHLHLGIGHGIITGTGPSGGAGRGFNAVAFLRAVLAGAGTVVGWFDGDDDPLGDDGGGGGIGGVLGGVGGALGTLTDPAFWWRAVWVLIGLGLVIIGALALASGDVGRKFKIAVKAVV